MYILHFVASTTAEAELITISSSCISATAFITSDNLPTPDGSMIIRSGEYSSSTCFNAFPKSPTREQQIHPEFISLI